MLKACFLASAVLLLVRAAYGAPETSIRVDATTVAISVPRGECVVLFSCTRTNWPRSIAVRPAALVLRDDDNDGVIRYTPDGGVPLRSVWIAVDQASGEEAVGAQPDFPVSVSPIGSDNLKKDVEGEIATLALGIPRLSLLLVRPGKEGGAWMMTAFDGQSTDHDGTGDGRVELSSADAKPVAGKDNAPKHLRKGDIVAVIAPGHLGVFVATAAHLRSLSTAVLPASDRSGSVPEFS
jgi:hypothetical protein